MVLDITEVISRQRKFFAKGETLSIPVRLRFLKKLKEAVIENEDNILNALEKDLGKHNFEAYLTEVRQVKSELGFHIAKLKRWASPEKKKTPLLHFFSRSYVYSKPYGVVLIISPWNFPFNLSFIPLIGAISGGNCVVLKPSRYSPETTEVMANIIGDVFPLEYVTVVTGGEETNEKILNEKYDFIFFTGGRETGKKVMMSASQYLTPAILELGGKCPCIVDCDAHLESASRRVVWGKFLNAGQTCIAPDYLLVDESIKEDFVKTLEKKIIEFYGDNPCKNPDYGRIINDKHFDRIMSLIEGSRVIFGGEGNRDKLCISPTLVDNVNPDDPIMDEEVFGPVLPIIQYKSLEEAIDFVEKLPVPLACYFFSRNRKKQEFILKSINSGGICINDTVIHFDNRYLPFGGKGESGMGRYHGKYSFETFTYKQAVMIRRNKIELGLRYPPFKGKLNTFRRII